MINGKTVSLCMVIYNPGDLLVKAIGSVKSIIDEIVIVDQGSTESVNYDYDGEVILHKTTNKGNADYDRQFCYMLATKDYILALDADETVPETTIQELEKFIKYDFDVAWFQFNNQIRHGEKLVDLKPFLGDDPHPRFWKRLVNDQPVVIWPTEAHQFPNILSNKQIFLECKFDHIRELEHVIATHLRRGKNILPQAVKQEKEFIRGTLQQFGFDIQQEMTKKFPELRDYLKG